MIFIGIDPGLSGAVGVINKDAMVEIFDVPTIEMKKGKKVGRDYDTNGMADIIRKYSNEDCTCFLEKVSAMPGQGVTSMFGFGKGYGIWQGIIASFRIPLTLVTPQAWKKEIMQGIGDKDAARMRAGQLFPSKSSFFSRKKDDGRAEALLIAEYGRRMAHSITHRRIRKTNGPPLRRKDFG
jgi:crossover junction endodeoxyribonuclease RuvC